ncbi:hypothetical protein R50076_31150 [Gilvimarinus japonicus]
MYIRFETDLQFSDSSCAKGIFAAMGDAKRKGSMSLREHVWYINVASWFNFSLKNPACFERPICNTIKFRAQSWFKLSVSEHLDKSLSVAQLLRKHGITVHVRLADEPGSIVYRDNLQIVVVPNA